MTWAFAAVSQGVVSMSPMCEICDGATWDEARFSLAWRIYKFGWSITYVDHGTDIQRAWAYTVGLAAGFGHPELLVPSVSMDEAGSILNALGEMVRGGHAFGPRCVVEGHPSGPLRVAPVHPVHFRRGVFATWTDYYEAIGEQPPARALEIVLPGRKPKLLSASSRFAEPPR